MRVTVTMLLLLAAPVVAIGCRPVDEQPVESPPPQVQEPPLALEMNGIGRGRVGMTIAEAEALLGPARAERIEPEDSCGQVTFASLPEGVSFMVMGDRLVRADIHTDQVRTTTGLGIGSTEASVLAAFPGQLLVEEHPYDGPEGHYLIVTNPAWPEFRMIFETSGGVVSSFRAGRLPEVRLIEGCS